MTRRKDYTQQIAAAWARVVNNCGCDDLYYCPTAGDIECPRHSGFSTCCKRPRRHIPVATPDATDDDPRGETVEPAAPRTINVRRSPFAVPNIDTDNLDFDDFHPLDHTLADCTGYPGGRRRHLTYRWEFFARPWLYAHTLCRIGLHERTTFTSRNNTSPRTENDQWYAWDGCIHCPKRLSNPQPL